MENNVTLAKMIETLEYYFSKLNERFFENKLSKPVITISPDTTKHGSYGWCTAWKAWKDSNTESDDSEGYFEINICAETLNLHAEHIFGTLLHEMVHLENVSKGINDCSRNGTYHNRRFRDTAEAHGLLVKKDEKYGWCDTTLNDEAKSFIQSLGDSALPLYRLPKSKSQNSTSSTRKYVCPCCKTIIRATRDVYVKCGLCNEAFRLEKK